MQEDVETSSPAKKRGRRNSNKYDATVAKTVTLAANGRSKQEIAKIVGIPETKVGYYLANFKPLLENLPQVPEYRAKKSDILDAAELAALKTLMKKLPSATCREAVYAFDRLHNAGRLTRGESTANVAVGIRFTTVDMADISND